MIMPSSIATTSASRVMISRPPDIHSYCHWHVRSPTVNDTRFSPGGGWVSSSWNLPPIMVVVESSTASPAVATTVVPSGTGIPSITAVPKTNAGGTLGAVSPSWAATSPRGNANNSDGQSTHGHGQRRPAPYVSIWLFGPPTPRFVDWRVWHFPQLSCSPPVYDSPWELVYFRKVPRVTFLHHTFPASDLCMTGSSTHQAQMESCRIVSSLPRTPCKRRSGGGEP